MARNYNDCTDAELGRITRTRYDEMCKAHDAGMDDRDHPAERWAQDTEVLKAYRASVAKDEENTGGSPRNIQRTPAGKQIKSGADTDQPEITGGIAGEHPAMDGVLSSDQNSKPVFTFADGRVVTGDRALEASARCSNPVRVRAMKRAIPSYGRLK